MAEKWEPIRPRMRMVKPAMVEVPGYGQVPAVAPVTVVQIADEQWKWLRDLDSKLDRVLALLQPTLHEVKPEATDDPVA